MRWCGCWRRADLPLTLDEVLQAAGGVSDEVMARLRLFFAERVEFYLREVRGQAYDVAKAVMVSGQDDLRDLVARAEAVTAVRSGENAATFLAVAAAFKRMRNILEQAHGPRRGGCGECGCGVAEG